MIRALLLALALAASPARASFAEWCHAPTAGPAEVFGRCTYDGDGSIYSLTTVYRNGTRLRPRGFYVNVRRGAAPTAAVLTAWPPGLVLFGAGVRWRCAGTSDNLRTPPARCPHGILRLDVAFPNRGTLYPQLVLTAKYTTGVTVGAITTAGPMEGSFWNGWEPDELADVLTRCLPAGAQPCNYYTGGAS